MTESAEQLAALRKNLRHVIRGKHDIIDLLIVALLGNGHVLVEDVPGVGKTTLARAIALSIDATCHRIQFTPDLLPTDIVGGMIYSPKSGEFSFRAGPVFCHILLADEVNRASPRTQSALLEAMAEQQVTVEGETRPLGAPFMVVATQNPIEYQGTYPLPEAQLDRFAMRVAIGYPDSDTEMAVVLDQRTEHPLVGLQPVLSVDDIFRMQKAVCDVTVEASVGQYMVELTRATRTEPRIKLGASPRGALTLYRMSQALALLSGRTFVRPDDVQRLAGPVLAHRIALDLKAEHAGVRPNTVIDDIVASIKIPV